MHLDDVTIEVPSSDAVEMRGRTGRDDDA